MRHLTTLSATLLAVGMLTSAGCSEQAPELTAPESSTASFQRQNVAQSGVTAGNLLAALNQVNANIQDFIDVEDLQLANIQVVNVEDVLNNADILNNSPFLNNVTVLQDFLNDSLNDLNVQILNNALNNNDVVITDVVAIDVLSGGDLLVFTR